ncbi:MAG: hypothetical protein QY306_12520 [Anaerolineales bacterium]|nr:MAG: hypothetical protein QY306_12520 [Anaerolineales bacterium]
MKIQIFRRLSNTGAIFLALISAAVYLPYTLGFTYYLDEWYFIYDGVVAGPNVFHAMFSIDRPARGYFFDVYFSLFGPNLFPYQVGAYLWRLFAGLCAFWLFTALWPKHEKFAFSTALLFILYPGYSWWISAIEYQPHIASLALQVFSCLMTVVAIKTPGFFLKTIYALLAIVSGWAYLSLVEYAIGFEVFRFICVYLSVLSSASDVPKIGSRIFATLRAWSWSASIPAGFIIWRLFFFENLRQATDINLQASKFFAAPLETLQLWGRNLLTSLTNVGIRAWYESFWLSLSEVDFHAPYFEMDVLIVAASLLVGLVIFGFHKLGSFEESGTTRSDPAPEAAFLGFVSLLAGVLPVVLANRYINLSFFSYYGLPVSLAASVFLAGLISRLFSGRRITDRILMVFVIIAGGAHLLLAQRTVIWEKALMNFWWQASWRIPDLRPDATIVTLYPYDRIVDDEFGLDGPVNLIYFPGTQAQIPIRLPVSVLMPTEGNVELIRAQTRRISYTYRTHKSIIDYGNILLLVQPTPTSCVRVLTGSKDVFSEDDTQLIKDAAVYSDARIIRLYAEAHIPPTYAFGVEPDHSWCFFYEKADLAVQRQDWALAAELGNEALSLELSPYDVVEWYPFIRAFAMTADIKKLEVIALKTAGDEYFNDQLCRVFQDESNEYKPDPNIQRLLVQLFCK